MEITREESSTECIYCGAKEISFEEEYHSAQCFACGALTFNEFHVFNDELPSSDSTPRPVYLVRNVRSRGNFSNDPGVRFCGPTNAWGAFIDGGRLLGRARRACVEFTLSRPLFSDVSLRLRIESLENFQGHVLVCFENQRIYTVTDNDFGSELAITIPKDIILDKTKLDLCFYVHQKHVGINESSPEILLKDLQLMSSQSRLEKSQVINLEDNLRVTEGFETKFCAAQDGKRRGFEDLMATRLLREIEHYDPEEFGIWLSKTHNVMTFVLDGFEPTCLNVTLVSPFVGQKCQLSLNNIVLKKFTFNSKFEALSLDVSDVPNSGICVFGLEFEYNYNLKEMGLNDVRIIPAGIASFGLE